LQEAIRQSTCTSLQKATKVYTCTRPQADTHQLAAGSWPLIADDHLSAVGYFVYRAGEAPLLVASLHWRRRGARGSLLNHLQRLGRNGIDPMHVLPEVLHARPSSQHAAAGAAQRDRAHGPGHSVRSGGRGGRGAEDQDKPNKQESTASSIHHVALCIIKMRNSKRRKCCDMLRELGTLYLLWLRSPSSREAFLEEGRGPALPGRRQAKAQGQGGRCI
jgi:hypothetical protein